MAPLLNSFNAVLRKGDAENFRTMLATHPAVVSLKPWGDHGSLLHAAAEEGHAEIVTHLLEANAGLGVLDKDGQTPLHIASLHGHRAVVEALTPYSMCDEVTVVDKYQMTVCSLRAACPSTPTTPLVQPLSQPPLTEHHAPVPK